MRVPEESRISSTRLFAGRLDPTVSTKSRHVKHKLKRLSNVYPIEQKVSRFFSSDETRPTDWSKLNEERSEAKLTLS